MKEVLLFSTNELAQRINYYIENGDSVTPMTVKGFVVDDTYYSENMLDGKIIYRYSEAKEKFLGEVSMLVCIGYKNMNENRKNIFQRLQAEGWDISNYISKKSTIESNDMGIGNIFLGRSSFGFKSRLGNGNIFDKGSLSHHSVAGDFNFFTCDIAGGNITIGDCCFFGMNSCLKDGISIHDKTLVGASCYLGRSTIKPGICYMAPRAILLENSETAMEFWTSK